MATSGTTAFDLSVDELIEEAYERCGVELRTGYDLESARRSLNIMMADWANRGLNQWTIEQRSVTVTSGTNFIDIGTDVVDVTEAVIRRSGTDIQLSRISRSDFLFTPSKGSTGRPNQYFLDRQTTPRIFLFPTPENSTDTLIYNALTRIQDAGDYTNNMEIVFRFIPCMTSGLAYYLAIKYAPQRTQELKLLYEDELQRALSEDGSSSSTCISPKVYYPEA